MVVKSVPSLIPIFKVRVPPVAKLVVLTTLPLPILITPPDEFKDVAPEQSMSTCA